MGSAIGIVVGAFAFRHFVGPEILTGGALASFPSGADGFFSELVSAIRSTILGGAQPASPALAVLGSATWVSFGNAALAQKVLLAFLVPLAGIVTYRTFARQTARPGTAVVAAGRLRPVGRRDVVLL